MTGVDETVGTGGAAADTRRKAELPGGSWSGFAIGAVAGPEKRWEKGLSWTQSGVKL